MNGAEIIGVVVGMLIVISHVWTAYELHMLRMSIAEGLNKKIDDLSVVLKAGLVGNALLALMQSAAYRRHNRGEHG